MIHVLRKLLFLMAVATLSASVLIGDAHPVNAVVVDDEHDDALKAIKRGDILSYSAIRRTVEKKLNGRVVDLRLRRTNRGWQYFLRVSQKNGRVVAAVVDARNGRILSTR